MFLADANQTEDHKLLIGSLDSQETRVLVGAVSNLQFARPGYLLFVRAGTLVAQPFDTGGGELAGEPMVNLFASTSGTDSDWVVKLIDVYPESGMPEPKMNGYQFMVANDVLRGRYYQGWEKPTPIVQIGRAHV